MKKNTFLTAVLFIAVVNSYAQDLKMIEVDLSFGVAPSYWKAKDNVINYDYLSDDDGGILNDKLLNASAIGYYNLNERISAGIYFNASLFESDNTSCSIGNLGLVGRYILNPR
ncbi:hypothetical protein, partial [Fulvivirga lutimaris]|uniref:hypothetical protein n=1 Tax=Fulvivirga lutimaris TaxID=1819566 RepID=UPI0012BBE5C6